MKSDVLLRLGQVKATVGDNLIAEVMQEGDDALPRSITNAADLRADT